MVVVWPVGGYRELGHPGANGTDNTAIALPALKADQCDSSRGSGRFVRQQLPRPTTRLPPGKRQASSKPKRSPPLGQ